MNNKLNDCDKISIDIVKGLGDLSAKFVEQIIRFADDVGVNRTKAVSVCVNVLSYAMNKNVSFDKFEVDECKDK